MIFIRISLSAYLWKTEGKYSWFCWNISLTNRLDLGQREHSGRQRVVGDGVEDQRRVAGSAALDGHLLDR